MQNKNKREEHNNAILDRIAIKDNTILQETEWRIANRDWLSRSFSIALYVLKALDDQKLSQKELAEKMGVSPQYISKIVKGSENLSLETITKLESALGIKLIEVITNTKPKTTKTKPITKVKKVAPKAKKKV